MRRNISWHESVNGLAEELAFEHRMKGGVSEFLTRLVLEARKLKRRLPSVTDESVKVITRKRAKP